MFRIPLPSVCCLIVSLLSLTVASCDEPEASRKPSAEEKENPRKANRLGEETSPYLLQHAYNPVDWYPWGEEAFQKAQKEGKLIFLSVGYSSCHWCHVMEHESFEDEEIAAYLNKHFVCVKVDREERPDVDGIYMQTVQMLTGRGGWPMSVFMTADARPFYGGSYYPSRDGDRPGMPGFMTLLNAIQQAWQTDKNKILESAEAITSALQQQMDVIAALPVAEPSMQLVDRVQERLAEQFDAEYGGFSSNQADPRRPKFPEPSNLFYLLHRCRDDSLPEETRTEAQRMLVRTLDMMAGGGIQDHLGGGFHRYSVDRFWHIPHFEKMLYDNGQLASVYAEAYELTGNQEYRWVLENLLAWVARDMIAPQGGFYSAMDADSEGEEGKYFRWSLDELKQTITASDYPRVSLIYGLDGPPNFEEHYYVPQTGEGLDAVAKRLGQEPASIIELLNRVRAGLRKVRDKRTAPGTDTKILTAWNGLMIRGFADAGRILKHKPYLDTASKAAQFILDKMRREDGRLYRSYGAGEARLNAYLDDYAFFVNGLLALYQADGDKRWLIAARELTDKQLEEFWDPAAGGFFFTGGNHETLITRAKDPVDSALPSGNSVSAENLLLLASIDDGQKPEALQRYLTHGRKTVEVIAGLMHRSPTSVPRLAPSMRLTLAMADEK